MDPVKLAKLKSQQVNRLGGKGTPRRKVIKKSATTSAANDQKLQGALKKLNLQPITGVEEVNMFQNDGYVLHFTAPKVHAALTSNTIAVYGAGHPKELTELVPGILNQLGPDSLASLRRLAEQYQSQSAAASAAAAAAGVTEGAKEGEDDDDDDVPDLVDAVDQATLEDKKEEAPKAEEKNDLDDLN